MLSTQMTLNWSIAICWTNTHYLCECSSILGSPSPLCMYPSCLRRFGDLRKKHALDFMSMYVIHVVIFNGFQGPLAFFLQIWPICSNDYASKTRIGILCKKTCSTAPHLFPKSHLLNNSCGYRTFARMSTWAIELINIHAQSNSYNITLIKLSGHILEYVLI